MRPVYNACSGEPDDVPDDEVNAHLGNPGWKMSAYIWEIPAKGKP